jgi:hypothetical protein
MGFPVIRTRQTGNVPEDRARDDIATSLAALVQSDFVRSFLSGVLLSDKALAVGSNSVVHGLGRQPVGYIVTWSEGAAPDFYVTASDEKRLTLSSASSATVDLWVF